MATYHLSLKDGKVGTAKLHCEYINREGRYARGKKQEELAYKESGNLPSWAEDAANFFEHADIYERQNGNAYTEFEVALPNELSLSENIKLVQNLVAEYVGNNKVYSFAIHQKKATLDESQDQPHAHIMFCERVIIDTKNVKQPSQFFKRYNAKNKELGGYKKDNRFFLNKHVASKNLTIIRKYWENQINDAYQKNGINKRVSCETLITQREIALAQGDHLAAEELNRPAQNHLGPKLAAQTKREIQKDDFNIEFLSEKAQVAFLARRMKEIKRLIKEEKEYIEKLRGEVEGQVAINDALKKEVQGETIRFEGSELMEQINRSPTAIANKINANNAKIKELSNQITSDQSIERMALSIYTKQATSKIAKGLRIIADKKATFEKDLAEFNARPKPGFFDFNAKEEYKNAKIELDKRKAEIDEIESKLIARKNYYDKEMAKPERQEQLQIIKNNFLLQRASTRKFIDELRNENKELSSLGKELLVVNKTLSRKLHYELPKETANSLNGTSIASLQNVLRSIKHSINKLRDASPQGNNRMKVNLRSRTKERSEEYDMGI